MSLSDTIASAAALNDTLLQYLFPTTETLHPFSARRNWVPYTHGCNVATDCFCAHVAGEMSRALNPTPSTCFKAGASPTSKSCDGRCNCLVGQLCLFSDMRPAKILAVIVAARAAGVTHIIEEGRFGGLSAFMYWLHGFRVTSVEFLPLSGPTETLRKLAPDVALLDGDGSVLLPQLLGSLTPGQAAKTAVIFDGEKRFIAYNTYKKVRNQVAFAVFDDTNIGAEGPVFVNHIKRNERDSFDTRDKAFAQYLDKERVALTQLRGLKNVSNRQTWWGGVHQLERFHFTIVRGGAWPAR